MGITMDAKGLLRFISEKTEQPRSFVALYSDNIKCALEPLAGVSLTAPPSPREPPSPTAPPTPREPLSPTASPSPRGLSSPKFRAKGRAGEDLRKKVMEKHLMMNVVKDIAAVKEIQQRMMKTHPHMDKGLEEILEALYYYTPDDDGMITMDKETLSHLMERVESLQRTLTGEDSEEEGEEESEEEREGK